MINKLLHALSNRAGPFAEPLFISDPGFQPATLPEPERKIREAMLLQVTDNDYYLKAYLAAIAAYPDIQLLADDSVVSYQMTDFPPQGVEVSGGDMTSNSNMVGFFTDPKPVELPVNLNWSISYLDTHYLMIQGRETGVVRRTTYQPSGTAPNQTLRIDWPSDVPFQGPINLSQVWELGATVIIQTTPSAFPYQQVVDRLRGNWWLMHLLAQQKFVDEYTTFPDAQRKVALACMALALSNPSVYPS